MSAKLPVQEGATIDNQDSELLPNYVYEIDEARFKHWQRHWDSKQEVIDELLLELERAMNASQTFPGSALKVVQNEID